MLLPPPTPPQGISCTYVKHINVIFASKSWRCEGGGGEDETFHLKTHATTRGAWDKNNDWKMCSIEV